MTTLYSLGYRSTALPVHSSYTKGQVMLSHEQCFGGQNDQRMRRRMNSRTKVLLRTLGPREGRYRPRNSRGRQNQGKQDERKGSSAPSSQAQQARSSGTIQ